MASSPHQIREHAPAPAFNPSGTLSLTSFPPELMVKIASSLDPRTVLALIHTAPGFTYLLCVLSRRYRQEEVALNPNYTPLQYFVSLGVERAVLQLLVVGTDPNYASSGNPKFQLSPLIHAIHSGSTRMVSLLLRYGASVEPREDPKCWEFGVDPNPLLLNDSGTTPLQIALIQRERRYNHHSNVADPGPTEFREIVKMLLDAGADVTALTLRDFTPLHIACGTLLGDPVLLSALIWRFLGCMLLRSRCWFGLGQIWRWLGIVIIQ